VSTTKAILWVTVIHAILGALMTILGQCNGVAP
jgi:hypothetical protein